MTSILTKTWHSVAEVRYWSFEVPNIAIVAGAAILAGVIGAGIYFSKRKKSDR